MQLDSSSNLDKESFIGKTIKDIDIYSADDRVQIVITFTDGTSPSIVVGGSAASAEAGAGAGAANAPRPSVDQVDTPWDDNSSQ